METETPTRTCRYCKGAGELPYGRPPAFQLGLSFHAAVEQHMWEPDYRECPMCDGKGARPVGGVA